MEMLLEKGDASLLKERAWFPSRSLLRRMNRALSGSKTPWIGWMRKVLITQR